jgi:hypothetical protein
MPLFQYFGWAGASLFVALPAANWCMSAPIAAAPRSDVPLDQRINIRIHTDHKWPERVVFDTTRQLWHKEATHRLTLADARRPLWRNANRSTHSRRWRLGRSGHVFDHPAPVWPRRASSHQLGIVRQFKIARARRLWRARASLSPIGFTSRKEEVDAFAHERW